MTVSDLDKMMENTEFMGMALGEKGDKYTEERWNKALGAVGDTDIAAQIAEENKSKMEVFGELQVVMIDGVNGRGTLHDVVGNYTR